MNIVTKRNHKKIILGVLLVLVVLIALLVLMPKTKNSKVAQADGEKEKFAHTEAGIIKEAEYKGIKLTNISMITENGYTTFTADATNVSDKDISTERFHISLKDKDGNEQIKLLAYIPKGLKVKETKTITASAKGEFQSVVTKELVD